MQKFPAHSAQTSTLATSHRGFLLTRRCFDTDVGIEVRLWLKTATGPVELIITEQRAVFFVESQSVPQAKQLLAQQNIELDEIKSLALTAFNQQQVSGFYFKQLNHFYLARSCLNQHQIKCYEDDFRPDERFLTERFITADMVFSGIEQYLSADSSYRQFKQVRCKALAKEQQTDVNIESVSLDIECSPQGELYSVGLYHQQCQQVLMIASPEQQQAEQIRLSESQDNIDICWFADEKRLLIALLHWFTRYDPDVIIGWNVVNFDFRVLQKRYDFYQLAFTIGRDNSIARWRKNKLSEQQFIEINGRVVIDGIDLLKNATYNFASFSLENVAQELLGIGKKVADVDNRLQEIIDNFHHNKIALAKYNLEDCRLVAMIFAKTLLLEFAILRAQLTGLSLDRIGGSVAAFTNLYLPRLHRHGYVAPNMGDGHQGFASPGGYVMDSVPGLYKNVLVLDFKSLYPSIIRSFNIDPMGLIEGLKQPEQAIAGFDGAFFSRTEHFLPAIIERLWQERDKAKREQNSALSQALKIIMNSFYGVLGSTGCRFFDPRLSGSITKRSHQILKDTKAWIEDKGLQVIYGDTDSIFVHLSDDLTAEQCQTRGKQLQHQINQYWHEKLNQEFAINSALEIEFETHYQQFFMPTIRGQEVGTKKRYAGLITKNGEQKLIFKGLETVRTDWTLLAKEFQQALYLKIFNQQPVIDYIQQIVAQTLAGQHDDKLVYRKRLRRKLERYVKNVPPHVRAARAADAINKQQGKPLKYQNKGWIEYVITINGPQAVGYQSAKLDYQFYIDRQLQAVADAILPVIGQSFEQITNGQLDLF